MNTLLILIHYGKLFCIIRQYQSSRENSHEYSVNLNTLGKTVMTTLFILIFSENSYNTLKI